MPVRELRLTSCLSDKETGERYAGTLLDASSYDVILREDADVYKPDGTILCTFRRKVLPMDVCRQAYPAIREAAVVSTNRGIAGGTITSAEQRRTRTTPSR